MIDKVQKIREEVERIQLYTQSEVLKQVLDYIDEVQKEPVSEDICNQCEAHHDKDKCDKLVFSHKCPITTESSDFDLDAASEEYTTKVLERTNMLVGNEPVGEEIDAAFRAGAQWQKTKDESTTEDLGEYINELSKQFPEVSFAKLSRIAVRVAKWQKEQFEKNRLKHCDSITNEQAELEQGFIDQHLDKYQRMPTFLDAVEYGMRLQKEQMMAKAIDGVVTFDYYGDGDKTYGCIAHDSFCLEDFGLKDKDKVKMILIKEN